MTFSPLLLQVMQIAGRVLAGGAIFSLAPPVQTMIPSARPVIGITAVRTGAGKSQTSRYVIEVLKEHGLSCGLVRHPMPCEPLLLHPTQPWPAADGHSQL